MNGDGGAAHVRGDRGVSNFTVVLISPDEVAMGENSGERAIGFSDDSGTGAAFEHGKDSVLDQRVKGDLGESRSRAHDVGDAGEEVFAEAPAGVELGKVLSAEPSFL